MPLNLSNLCLSVLLPPAVTDSQESCVFLHFDRPIRCIIAGFSGSGSIKGLFPVISTNRKMSSISEMSVNNTQQNQRCSFKPFFFFVLRRIDSFFSVSWFGTNQYPGILSRKWFQLPGIIYKMKNFGDVLTLKFEQQFNNRYFNTAVGGAKPGQDTVFVSIPYCIGRSDFIKAIVFLFHPLSSLFIPWRGSQLRYIISMSHFTASMNLSWQLQAAQAAKTGFCRLVPSLY